MKEWEGFRESVPDYKKADLSFDNLECSGVPQPQELLEVLTSTIMKMQFFF